MWRERLELRVQLPRLVRGEHHQATVRVEGGGVAAPRHEQSSGQPRVHPQAAHCRALDSDGLFRHRVRAGVVEQQRKHGGGGACGVGLALERRIAQEQREEHAPGRQILVLVSVPHVVLQRRRDGDRALLEPLACRGVALQAQLHVRVDVLILQPVIGARVLERNGIHGERGGCRGRQPSQEVSGDCHGIAAQRGLEQIHVGAALVGGKEAGLNLAGALARGALRVRPGGVDRQRCVHARDAGAVRRTDRAVVAVELLQRCHRGVVGRVHHPQAARERREAAGCLQRAALRDALPLALLEAFVRRVRVRRIDVAGVGRVVGCISVAALARLALVLQ